MSAAKRTLFRDLIPGDVLVHCSNSNDVCVVLDVREELDLLNLVDGRFLEAWVSGWARVPEQYHVLRGDVLFAVATQDHSWSRFAYDV